MAEEFNAELYRQQMSGQAPAIPEHVPVHVQNVHAGIVQTYHAPQMPAHAPQQQMVPPMPQTAPMQPHSQSYVQLQPQAQPQPYNPSTAGQPQAWNPQGRVISAPQMAPQQAGMPHMPQAPAFSPPPAAMAEEVIEEFSPKKSRFSLKRSKTDKAQKTKEAKTMQAGVLHTAKSSSVKTFILGFACGEMSFFIGSMLLSRGQSPQRIQDVQTQNVAIEQSVLPQSAINDESGVEISNP